MRFRGLLVLGGFALTMGVSHQAMGAACPAVDNGAMDDDGLANGIITISNGGAADTFGTPTDTTGWACGGLTFLVKAGATLTIPQDLTNTGFVGKLIADEVLVEPGGVISSDGLGCAGGTNAANGSGLDGSAECAVSATGAGASADPAQGGAYGGISGANTGRYGPAMAPELWGSGGAGFGGAGDNGGAGGGVVSLELLTGVGRLINNGVIRANGVAGANNGGGGSGGSVYVNALIAQGAGTFEAKGGAGGGTGNSNGGGGGKIAVQANSGDTFVAGDFVVTGGAKTGTGVVGGTGTVFVRHGAAGAAAVTFFHGFSFDDVAVTQGTGSITVDTTASTNLYCSPAGAGIAAASTPALSAQTLTLRGSIDCGSAPSISTFALTGTTTLTINNSFALDVGTAGATVSINGTGSTFTMGTGVTLTVDGLGSDLDIDFATSSTHSWSGITVNGAEADTAANDNGMFTINDATVNLTLTGSSKINANVDWTLNNLTLTSTGDEINAMGLGCQGGIAAGAAAQGPTTPANVCTASTTGFGGVTGDGSPGGSHGGLGGAGSGTGGIGVKTSDSFITGAPFWGSGGGAGDTDADGGNGGGRVRLILSGTFTHNGIVSVDGEAGKVGGSNEAGGGGSGGTAIVSTNSLVGTNGKFYARGGAGGDGSAGDGGGGGGGRIYVVSATGGSFFPFVGTDTNVSGGAGPGTADNGVDGTAIARAGSGQDLAYQVFHGFELQTANNINQTGGSFIIDQTAADNITCDATATNLSIRVGGVLNVAGQIDCIAATLTDFDLRGASVDFAAGFSLNIDDPAADFTGFLVTADSGNITMGAGNTLTLSGVGADAVFNFASGSSQTWSNFDVTGSATGSFSALGSNASLTLSGGSVIASNFIADLLNLTLSSTSDKIQANGLGCVNTGAASSPGFGPNGSNVCSASDGGYGAGAGNPTATPGGTHGGVGGDGGGTSFLPASSGGDTPYNDQKTAVLYGSSAGKSGAVLAGSGGGIVQIQTGGTLNNGGAIEAKGTNGVGDGTTATGGGSGGSIYIRTDAYTGNGTVSAAGGNGVNESINDSGGGGGGRVSIRAGKQTGGKLPTFTAAVVATGGTNGGGQGTAGANGTAFVMYNGVACFIASDCYASRCVDAVCCDTLCGSGAMDCQACSTAAGASTNGTCGPANSSFECRPPAGPCDVAETCGGNSICPSDTKVADNTICNSDGLYCNGEPKCLSGACVGQPSPDCDDTNDCTIDSCDEVNDECVNTDKADNSICAGGGTCQTGMCSAPDASVDASVDASFDTVPPPDTTMDLPPADTSIDAPVIVPDTSVDTVSPDSTVDGPVVVVSDSTVDTAVPTADSNVDTTAPTADSSVDTTAPTADSSVDTTTPTVDSSIDSDVPATDGPTVDGESTIDGAAGTDGTGGTGGTGGEPEGGCGGCTVSGQPDGSVLLFGLFVVGLAFRRRQRNR